MTQEDIIDLREKNIPQWKKDQFDAIYANADYIEGLRRRIEHLEEKLKSHNKDYAELEKQRDELLTVGEKMLGEFEKVTGYTYLPFDLLLTRIKEGEK